MLTIVNGVVRDSRIKVELIPAIAHGPLGSIHAIIVHQTGSSTAEGTLAGYRTEAKGTGTHFLIDRDGTVYQTVALTQKCWHIGPIKSRCFEEHVCSAEELKTYNGYIKRGFSTFVRKAAADELKKAYPRRYPDNSDAIGIELVAQAVGANDYEAVTPEQQRSLDWLIPHLLESLQLTRGDIYRHPAVSRKNPGEAASAKF